MKTTVWFARDRNGDLCMFLEKPHMLTNGTFYDKSMVNIGAEILKQFEWVTFEISPVEANLSVTKKRNRSIPL
jgi:hypothetical protein